MKNQFCTNCGNSISTPGICKSCGARTDGHKKFCQYCGVAINPEQVNCIKCGGFLLADQAAAETGRLVFAGVLMVIALGAFACGYVLNGLILLALAIAMACGLIG
jgi:predicted nucleic acid-binding Zn ribbon protein